MKCCYVLRIDRQHYYHTTLPAIVFNLRGVALTVEHRRLLVTSWKCLVENLWEYEIYFTK